MKILNNRFKVIKKRKDIEEDLYKQPIKKYQIYKNTNDRSCLFDWYNLQQEVYYDEKIAIEICEIINQLNESVINGQPELIELYQEEIIEKQNKLNDLKKEDENKFQEKIKEYDVISNSEIFKRLKNNYEITLKENLELKKQSKKYEEMIKNLMKKLQISLIKYEELTKSKESIWQKISKIFDKGSSIFE